MRKMMKLLKMWSGSEPVAYCNCFEVSSDNITLYKTMLFVDSREMKVRTATVQHCAHCNTTLTISKFGVLKEIKE